MKLASLQLARLVDEAPEGDEWLHEQKFDGYRILANVDHGDVELLSRRFKDWTAAVPDRRRSGLASRSKTRACSMARSRS